VLGGGGQAGGVRAAARDVAYHRHTARSPARVTCAEDFVALDEAGNPIMAAVDGDGNGGGGGSGDGARASGGDEVAEGEGEGV